MTNKKILYVNWGGLGDHLAFSTLPEVFSKLGYEFYISDKSVYRDNSHYHLIWGNNPYVKGISSELPNCGHLENWGLPFDTLVNFEPSISLHKNIENIYGVDSNCDHPKIYYQPKNIKEYNDYIFLDLNASSVANFFHNTNIILEYLETLKDEKVIYSLTENSYGKSVIDINVLTKLNFIPIKTTDIFNYTDLIYSCKKFVSLWSGGAHLSTAIKKSFKPELELVCFKADNGMIGWGTTNKSFFWYDCVNYVYC